MKNAISINSATDQAWRVAKLMLVGIFAIAFFGFASPTRAIELDYAVFGDGDGAVYAIKADGTLQWFQHYNRLVGTSGWANGGIAKNVGVGWSGVTKAFSGGDGVVYVVTANGDLRWYRHDGRFTGTAVWGVNVGGTTVGVGWGSFTKVFSGGDGVIYAIQADGILRWYRHTGWLTGANTWAAGSGAQIGTGWNSFSKVFSGDDGVIYGIQANGILRWYRHDGRLDGTFNWAAGSGAQIGTGWQNFRQVFSSGDGILYAAQPTGSLLWYRHAGWLSGANSWAAGSGTQIGSGWIVP
ncbi:MAG: tachylectin-related carbohydrate-binding protein [Candidatus Methylumidiphilus sp.]